MTVNKDEAEIDRILPQADIVCESLSELLGAVRPSTHDATGMEGTAPLEGGNGGVQMGGAPAMRRLLLSYALAVARVLGCRPGSR